MAVESLRKDEQHEEVLKIVTIKRLFGRMFAYKKDVAIVLALMAVVIGVNLANPLFMKVAVDTYIKNEDIPGLLYLVLVAIVLNILGRYATKLRIIRMTEVAKDDPLN